MREAHAPLCDVTGKVREVNNAIKKICDVVLKPRYTQMTASIKPQLDTKKPDS